MNNPPVSAPVLEVPAWEKLTLGVHTHTSRTRVATLWGPAWNLVTEDADLDTAPLNGTVCLRFSAGDQTLVSDDQTLGSGVPVVSVCRGVENSGHLPKATWLVKSMTGL